ncbi:MAG TPA: DUF2461 domain-containing protein [Acidobacteriaceae bacterium]
MAKASSTKSPTQPYFRKEGLTVLRALIRANHKDPEEARAWFNGNKSVYEAELKEPMLAVIRKITDAMLDFAPEHVRPAEKSLFRIYRDTRFSNDKRPYKDHIGAWWTHTGLDKTSGAGFYFHVAPKSVIVAAGVFMPEKEQLAAIRHWLVDHHADFRKLLAKPALRKVFKEYDGHALSRAPKGFPTELDGKPHPALDFIRARQWGIDAELPVEAALQPNFAAEITRYFRLAAPLVAALNTPIAASLEERSKARRPILFGLPDGPKSSPKTGKNQ